MFTHATKRESKLRLALEGPAGYGKTYTALRVGSFLAAAEGKRVALLDTEAGSASKYADLFDFDVVEIEPPYHPDKVVEAIKEAEAADYSVIVLDSLSHFWSGDGGLLSIVDSIAKAKYRGDGHRAWGDANALQQTMTNAILRARLHVIASMRTKKDYVRETDEKGKTKIRAAGTKTVQREEFDYEFDVIGRFDVATILAITKSRCSLIPPESFFEKPGDEFAETLRAWLADGESIQPTDEQKARLAAALNMGALIDPERFSEAAVERASAQAFGTTTDRIRRDEFEKLVERIESAVEAASAKPADETTDESEPRA